MRLPRTSRLIAATIVLFSILFMQLAVSAYACPALSLGHDGQMSGQMHGQINASMHTTPADMVPCEDMDMEQPNLCHASHQTNTQSLDKPATPPLAPFVAVGYGLPIGLDVLSSERFTGSPTSAFLTHATAPPLAIRHCCFRI